LFERAGDLPFTRRSFLSAALDRLEEGQHVYTAVENGKLLHYSWLIPRQEVSYSDYGQPIELPAGSAVVYDDYTYPAARGRGLHRASIEQRVHDAALMPDTNWIFTGVRADNPRSWRNFERLGFTIYCRCFREVRGGRTKLWMECE
jgi:GNAT superfamily N-acetyltransferase